MNRNGYMKSLLVAAFMLAFAGCGGMEGSTGNVTMFTKSTATASSATPRLESNLITGNTCTAGVSSGGTYMTDNVNVTISTTVTGTNPLPISITGYTITFVPKNIGSPVLTDFTPLTSSFSTTITPGSSVTVPVAVVTEQLKINMVAAGLLSPCSLSVFQYDVTISFHAIEVGSTASGKDITATLVVAIADRV